MVYQGETIEWASYTDEKYGYHVILAELNESQDLTEEKEKELISNGKYTCSKYTTIAIIVKAATLIGQFLFLSLFM